MVPSGLLFHQYLGFIFRIIVIICFIREEILKYADFAGCKNAVPMYESFDSVAGHEILPFKKDGCLWILEICRIFANTSKCKYRGNTNESFQFQVFLKLFHPICSFWISRVFLKIKSTSWSSVLILLPLLISKHILFPLAVHIPGDDTR